MDDKASYRILIVDDNRSIHDDFRKVLLPEDNKELNKLEAISAQLFDETHISPSSVNISLFQLEIDSAYQGLEGIELIKQSIQEHRPYALVFVDVRMPPGMDGIEMIKEAWKIDANIQTVICTAYSDYSWAETINMLGQSDRLLILKKPFDNVELKQIACAMITKWQQLLHIQQEIEAMKSLANQTSCELEKSMIINKSALKQLMQNSRMAAIGQLAAGVAHEINNPMSFVIGNYQILETYINDIKKSISTNQDNQQVTDKLQECSDILKESLVGLDRIKHIVLNLKSFSQEDNSKMEMVDINECINDALSLVNNKVKYESVVTKSLAQLPKISGCVSELKQVFVNILMNSSEAIKDKGEIKISTYIENNNIVIIIKDNGIGIDAKNVNNIFDPFYTTKVNHNEIGLGLSISYDIIKKHQGKIAVSSVINKGTELVIHLPIER